MRKSKLPLQTIFNITQTIIKEKPRLFRGRPRTYPDALIISISLYQTFGNLSYREALENTFQILGQAPSLSTYYSRISKLPISLLQKIRSQIAPMLFFIVDGTGFSFQDLYPLQFFRGSQIRTVKADVKVVPLIGVIRIRTVLDAEAGGPYASESKLVLEILHRLAFRKEKEKLEFQDKTFIGDKGYDSLKVMKLRP